MLNTWRSDPHPNSYNTTESLVVCKTLFTHPSNCIADLFERHQDCRGYLKQKTNMSISEFLPEEILKDLFDLKSSSKDRTRLNKKKQEWATANKLHGTTEENKRRDTIKKKKKKYININKTNQGWQDSMAEEQEVAPHSHMHWYNKWPSWQSNSSQSHNIFLIPKIPKCMSLCIFLLYIWKRTTTFWLNIKIKKYLFTVE